MATKPKSEYQFDLTGGQPALNLANTVSRRDDPERRKDHLETYLDLISFARQSQIVSAKEAQAFREHALHRPSEAQRSFRAAIVLRETLYRVFSAIAQSKQPAPPDLNMIGAFALEALRHRALARVNGGYGWKWRSDAGSRLDRILWPIAQSAVELLTSEQLKIVRFCEAPDCEWLFLDHSRNRSRRWCDMTTCGNREKARRHYRRAHR